MKNQYVLKKKSLIPRLPTLIICYFLVACGADGKRPSSPAPSAQSSFIPKNVTNSNADANKNFETGTMDLPNSTTSYYFIGGSVSGLEPQEHLKLTINGNSEELTLTQVGSYQFSIPLSENDPYSVAIKEHPSNKACVVQNASGIARSNVHNIEVNCKWTFPEGLAPRTSRWNNWTKNIATSDITYTSDTTYLYNSSNSRQEQEIRRFLNESAGSSVKNFTRDDFGNFYILSHSRIVTKISPDGQKKVLLVIPMDGSAKTGAAPSLVVDKEYLYLANPYDRVIYRVPIDGSTPAEDPPIWIGSAQKQAIRNGDEEIFDGLPEKASLCGPYSLSLNPSTGDIYFVDADYHVDPAYSDYDTHACSPKIRKISRNNGLVSTISIVKGNIAWDERPIIAAVSNNIFFMVSPQKKSVSRIDLSDDQISGRIVQLLPKRQVDNSNSLPQWSNEDIEEGISESSTIAADPISKILFIANKEHLFRVSLDGDLRSLDGIRFPPNIQGSPDITIDYNGNLFLTFCVLTYRSVVFKVLPAP